MFMKHYAPNRCEPSIEALNFRERGDQGRLNIYLFSFFFSFFFFFFWGGGGGEVRMNVNEELKFLKKNQEFFFLFFFFFFFFWGGGVRVDVNREVKFCENPFFFSFFFFLGGGGQVGGYGGLGGQGRCEQRIELFVKILKKKIGGGEGSGWGVMVDVNEELKFLRKFTQKKSGGSGGCSGWVGCSGWEGQGGCERRIEVFCEKKLKFCENSGGGGRGGLVGGQGGGGLGGGSGWMGSKN